MTFPFPALYYSLFSSTGSQRPRAGHYPRQSDPHRPGGQPQRPRPRGQRGEEEIGQKEGVSADASQPNDRPETFQKTNYSADSFFTENPVESKWFSEELVLSVSDALCIQMAVIGRVSAVLIMVFAGILWLSCCRRRKLTCETCRSVWR